MAEGFLGRWSTRKAAVREGRALEEPVPLPPAGPLPKPEATAAPRVTTPAAPTDEPSASPAPTLDQAQALTPEADFRPFVARGVAPEVRNTAFKKLFADPHFNLMDGLDVYIDDYSRPDPLPLAMLRSMVAAQHLKLVDAPARTTGPASAATAGAPSNVATSGARPEPPEPASPPAPASDTPRHDHPDL